MPRYFFHSANGTRHFDENGTELPDLKAAHLEAITTLGEMLRDKPEDLDVNGTLQVSITDDHANLLLLVTAIRTELPLAED